MPVVEKPHEMVVVGGLKLVLDYDAVIVVTGEYVYSSTIWELVFNFD